MLERVKEVTHQGHFTYVEYLCRDTFLSAFLYTSCVKHRRPFCWQACYAAYRERPYTI